MLDQFGNDVGPGYIGSNGDTVQSLSLAYGGDGTGGWNDPGVQAQYAVTQADNDAIRQLMATQGAGYMVTGTASAGAQGDTTAYLPQMMEAAGIPLTPTLLARYQELTGKPYASGQQISGYNPQTNTYNVGGGTGGMLSGGGTPTGTTPTGTPTPNYTVPTGQFGAGAANNWNAEQQNTIKGTWQQFLAGQKTKAEIQAAMSQYNVNFADISAATGIPVSTLMQQFGGSGGGTSAPAPSAPPPPAPPANFGSPYNPVNVTPNPDGSGTPYGSTHPKSGMVGGNTGGGSYDQQLNNYYNAYFKDAPGVDQGMLSNWYDTSYNPTPTGFSTTNKGASSAQGLVKSLDWGTPADDAKSTPQLYNYMNMYGLSAADVGKSLGFTEQQIIDHFKKYGIDVTSTNKPTTTTADTGAPDGYVDGQPYYDPARGGIVGGSRR